MVLGSDCLRRCRRRTRINTSCTPGIARRVIENGKIAKVALRPAAIPRIHRPAGSATGGVLSALLAFAEYWDEHLHDCAPASLPQQAWIDLSKHAFAKELMTRPGGIYPKYGAVDRDYGGSEYDGFQDIFTSAIYTNMEWGRLETATLHRQLLSPNSSMKRA